MRKKICRYIDANMVRYHVCVCVCVSLCVCVYVSACMCERICICIHTDTFIERPEDRYMNR